MAGLWCVNAGYSRREIADAIHAQAVRLPYYHSFSSMATEMPALLAERLLAMAPVPMSKVFFGSSGSDANDTQVKLVWFYNNALGRPAQEEDHRARPRLPRRHDRVREPDRAREHAHAVRPAAADDQAHDRPPPAVGGRARDVGRGVHAEARRRPRADDPRRGARDGRRVHRRAGAGRGRRRRPARRLLPGDPGGPAPLRRAADRRRGRDRLRTSRSAVRDAGARPRARPDHGREGHDLRVRAALGRARVREGLARARRRHRHRRLRPRLHLHLAPHRGRRGDGEPRPDRARGPRRAGRHPGRVPAASVCARPSPATRSSARCAGWG